MSAKITEQQNRLIVILHKFYASMLIARTHTISLASNTSEIKPDFDGLYSQNSAAWRKCARAGSSVANDIQSVIPDKVAKCWEARKTEVREYIRSVLFKNDTPRTSVAKLPSWVERRSSARVEGGREVVVEWNNHMQRVLVLNEGPDGIGVWGVVDGVAGMPVRLLLKPGHTATGQFAWVNGSTAGIAFNNNLSSL